MYFIYGDKIMFTPAPLRHSRASVVFPAARKAEC